MKRILATLSVGTALLFAADSHAQVQFGGKLGVNYAVGSVKIQPTPKDAPTNPKGLGLLFGGYAQIPFSDLVGLRPELTFSFRRLKTETTVTENFDNAQVTYNGQQATFTGKQESRTETDQRLQYFQVNTPLMITPAEGFRVMVGPSFGILMGGKQNEDVTTTVKGTLNGNQNLDQESFETTEKKGSSATKNFRKMDVAAMVGAGYTLSAGFDMDLRYYRSIVTTYDESQGSNRYRIWTNMIEFALGWTFGN